MKTLLTAAWVAPMDGPILRDGGVAYEGRTIVAVGAANALKHSHPDAIVHELGDVILLPGLVNAHCHLELALCRRPAVPVSFTTWVRHLVGEMAASDLIKSASSNVSTGLAACMRFGVTCVGDITSNPSRARGVLERPNPRMMSYGEVRAMATRRDRLAEQLKAAATDPWRTPWTRIGVSPHAPYSVEPEGYRQCLAIAKTNRLPLATHLAETAEEAEFLAAHRGPFRELWDSFGAWDDAVPTFSGGPIRYAKHLGLLDYERTSLAHVNYCDDDELALLAMGKASVVYCPRTHRYFGHPPHRWREMLAAGINVAVGTDSSASSPDLNLVDDLRLLREIAPDVPVEAIWAMATSRAARAVGMQEEVGSISGGKCADFVAFAATGDQPLRAI
ncbi:MAG: amidohydrolase family protein, partial [Planctomycetota bacterium]|nr:amidohydrolase family protein [Planctomycetota bacterium]